MTAPSAPHKTLSLFEFWPDSIFYTPIVIYWILMGLRHGDLSISTAANPRIETGGLCGESKSSILDMAGPTAQKAIAPYRIIHNGADAVQDVQTAMKEMDLDFPFVLKPDIGCNGTGVRLISSLDMLHDVLPLFPAGIALMVQQLITYPMEAGIFYIRHPDEKAGRITSLTYKEAPILTGNGRSTLKELVMADPRMRQVPQLYLPRIKGRENEVLPAGETLSLVFAGNHCKGSIFRDGRPDITPALTERINAIMLDIPDFHFGRIDLKMASPEALKRGEDFQIIEINGVGSEAIHIWDRRTTLLEAYRAQFYHYRQTFLIGAAKKKEGWKSSGILGMLRSWLKQRRLLGSYPTND
ncbi:D-alanine--D-alanine ligase [Bombella intestini]|uniref:D-alanine--D-alanine ligase n=1 Tax=Bombella intestini TaxID=1539051 RepID=A0A1S8GS04_9PROT|nr:D-alanine--D-alanine ligase [Bombella intestini]OOL19811.1 D-alanine--D-alanine ligase [Bombella intestini]